jgi:hypothetical protein
MQAQQMTILPCRNDLSCLFTLLGPACQVHLYQAQLLTRQFRILLADGIVDSLACLLCCPFTLPYAAAAWLQPRFLVDSMLGRLCRWLRALGVDAEFVETGGKQQLQQQARVEGQPLLLQSLGQQQQGQLIEAIHKAALNEVRATAAQEICLILNLHCCT